MGHFGPTAWCFALGQKRVGPPPKAGPARPVPGPVGPSHHLPAHTLGEDHVVGAAGVEVAGEGVAQPHRVDVRVDEVHAGLRGGGTPSKTGMKWNAVAYEKPGTGVGGGVLPMANPKVAK